MALTTHPFHPQTGDLLPGFRDAYLRGDLSGRNTELVDAYFKANPSKGGEAYQRFHALQAKGHDVRPVGWLQNQFDLIRTQPARFRQRAGGLLVVAALIGGAAFASTNLPTDTTIAAETPANLESAESTVAMTTVSGRILDENGRPLIGATVLDKRSGRGVSTDASGSYTMVVPANRSANLQFGYGGYGDENVLVNGHGTQTVTLLPRADAPKLKRHWWQF
ncbi:carboxypeptidase-like regulatory domain-containing protein [Hymenobacter sp. ASUV-10]|uniref:Carboxypeptidase-like regulatory domain-containing protein n=1 Tax=Hymenobacter aranciens TaxID=3063996 RepID=A0ABT9BJQ5_9BACT|nr:carboxypeptidase-like regulatory domain-containing protein [Hymenobacter sp. ASUV-10]MDO7876763.1 carboxypeptidase-like regulatory domain-containing protein [Hymenobacter sp. ASUV-10]